MIFGLSPYFIIMTFFFLSFLGWIYESIFVSVKNKTLVNRGFLVGPIIPLYGFSGVIIYILCRPFSSHASLLYVVGMLVASTAEFFTSWLLEKFFHTKWWDYSDWQFNLDGRIAILPSMFWGFITLLLYDILIPLDYIVIYAIPHSFRYTVMYALMTLTAADTIYTFISVNNFRIQLGYLYKIRTELETQFEDVHFKNIINTLKNRVSFSERIENSYRQLSELKNILNEDAKLIEFEKKYKAYIDSHVHLLKHSSFFGTRRIAKAFPSMKLLPSPKISVDVKEFLSEFNLKIKRK